MHAISRRRFGKGLAGLGVIGGLSGCFAGGETGTLATRVTDQPSDIDDFETCVVEITGIVVKPEEGERVQLDADASADLVELADDSTSLVGEHDLDAGEYEHLQLEVGEVDATLEGGEEADVRVPGDAPLTFNEAFEIRAGGTTTFVADFTPVQAGQAGFYELQPVPEGIEVTYGE